MLGILIRNPAKIKMNNALLGLPMFLYILFLFAFLFLYGFEEKKEEKSRT